MSESRNLYFGVLLAPYRLDYYNYIYQHMSCDIYFQLRNFNGQLFSTEELEAKCKFLPKYLNISRLMGDRQVVWGLRKLINENNPQFIVVPEFSFLTMQVIWIKIIFGYKYKIISQCDDSYAMLTGKGFSRFHEWSRKICMSFIDNIILLDSKSKEWYQEHYHKGIFMPLLTDESEMTMTEEVCQKVKEYKSQYELNSVKTLLYVGRLIEVKNLFSLLKACKLLKIKYKLIIVGDGVLIDELKKEAECLDVNIEFVGRKNGTDLTAWYYCADVFVLPSKLEPFGAVTNEALLCGCNCVISKVAGSACLIEEGRNGFLADPHSVDDIADKITKACALPVNAHRHSKMIMTFTEAMTNMEKEINRKVLKVFHVICHLDLGGAERVALNIAETKNGNIESHVVEVFRGTSDFSTQMKQELDAFGVQYHISPIRHKRLAILLFPFYFVLTYLKYRPDIIHAHTEITDLSLWLFRKISWLFFWVSPRYIRTIHNTELWNEWKWVGRIVERYYVKHKCNVSISKSVSQAYAYGQSDIPLIYNGVKVVNQKPFPNLVDGKVNVLFAGRLEHQKGIEQLVEVVTALKSDGRYHFHIVGSGSLVQMVKDSLGNLDCVSLFDKVYALSEYLGSFDYLFMPSNHEGLPLTCIEASLAHTPPIVNWCAGLNETLPDDWPLKVMDNDINAFVDLFRNKLLTYDHKVLADKAYDYAANHFSVIRMQESYEKLYAER